MKPNFIIKIFFTFFLFSASSAYFYANDKQQAQAVEQIRKEISRSIAQKNSSPIQAVLQRYKVRDAFYFYGLKKEDASSEISNFLRKRRPPKITRDEWLALKKSPITLDDSENNSASFMLLDLDEDGLRDLVVETYMGGTGLYSYIHVYRQRGGKFVEQISEKSTEGNAALYSINGRGGDQEAVWVRINGRVYLAYRDGIFGKDDLFLLRAFAEPADKMKGLSVEYSYRHDLPRRQKIDEKNVLLETGFHAALQKGLNKIQAQTGNEPERDFGKCPAPENLSAEQREEYVSTWFEPPHYTFEVAAEFPVFEKNRCYMARLINFLGSYSVKNKYVSTSLWLLRQPLGEREEYEVQSFRVPKRVKIADLEHFSGADNF